jgi:hypothetical protein
MSLKEEYIKLRNENKLNVDFLYKYYLNKVEKEPVNFTTFMSVIQFANVEVIFETLDSEFGVNRLYDSNSVLMIAF